MTVKKPGTQAIDLKALVAEDCDWMKSLIKAAVQEVLEAEMTELLGAGPHERQEGHQGYRVGYDERGLVTRVGKLELRVPRDRHGQFQTALFERYQRSEKALLKAEEATEPYATKQEAHRAIAQYIHGFYDPVRMHSSLGYCRPTSMRRDCNTSSRPT